APPESAVARGFSPALDLAVGGAIPGEPAGTAAAAGFFCEAGCACGDSRLWEPPRGMPRAASTRSTTRAIVSRSGVAEAAVFCAGATPGTVADAAVPTPAAAADRKSNRL